MKFKLMAVLVITAALYSCDDSTTGVGDFVSNIDKIEAFSDTYKVTSRTEKLDKIYSRTNRAYLGKYTDADFGQFSADFITQINCPENFELPEHLIGITGASLELYYTNYYGDSLATLTVQVDELDKVIEDADTDLYYTTYDPKKYYDETAKPLARKSYAAVDFSVSDSLRNTSTYYPNIKIDLGDDFSKRIQQKYTDNPEYFKDAYSFINNVLKGFYVHTVQGDGSVIYIQDIWLRLSIDYYTERESTGKIDSLAHGSSILAASKEVLMSTKMENDEKLKEMADSENDNYNKFTYLKTPAGLCTEVNIPIEDIYSKHSNDTINSVTLSIKKYRYSGSEENSEYEMGIPQNVLLVRKGDYENFFENNKTYDNKTSFLGTYSSNTNSYTFSKLNRLISQVFSEIRTGENNNEDRDKVLLIPVTTETDTEGNIIGVSHDMEVNAARLFGGEKGEELSIDIVYTRPNGTTK
ncbi:DUF4270 domain-containing protein [Bacteroides caecigallinarum]|nr:DUF4270 domain-containing protein [Bacteroides caecigallinarum]MBM6882767.1 DUF4270 domain-containing protein [Bacteroides caecigallinarum]MBM6890283.1 DUF4270 domain-containing protein [Bacteroides caecigallinarum]MCF2552745.1 DUF4270 domain-containing protein [Bacteroides caecigallinarum]